MWCWVFFPLRETWIFSFILNFLVLIKPLLVINYLQGLFNLLDNVLFVNSVSHYVTSLVTTPKIHSLIFKWHKCFWYVIDKMLSFVMNSHLITSNYVSIDVVFLVPQSIWESTELSFLHVQSISICCIWCKYKSDGYAFLFIFKCCA